MNPLKLIALDQDDIAIVSTHLQDAVVKVADIVWLPAEKRLVIGVNRFDWEACGEVTPCYQRRRTALRFERVIALRCRNVNPAAKDAVLNLLAVEFDRNRCAGRHRDADLLRRRGAAARGRMPRMRTGRSRARPGPPRPRPAHVDRSGLSLTGILRRVMQR